MFKTVTLCLENENESKSNKPSLLGSATHRCDYHKWKHQCDSLKNVSQACMLGTFFQFIWKHLNLLDPRGIHRLWSRTNKQSNLPKRRPLTLTLIAAASCLVGPAGRMLGTCSFSPGVNVPLLGAPEAFWDFFFLNIFAAASLSFFINNFGKREFLGMLLKDTIKFELIDNRYAKVIFWHLNRFVVVLSYRKW